MMISTYIYHHCGPRVAFCAATCSGSVWALALERKSANRYSFHAMISTRMKVAASPGLESGSTIDQKMRYREQPSTSAASSSYAGMLSKKSRISHTTMGMLAAM